MVFKSQIVKSLLSDQMDYKGQDLAYRLSIYIIWLSATVGFLVGIVLQKFLHTLIFIAGGTVIAIIICVPSWPMFCSHPIKWRAAKKNYNEKDCDIKKAMDSENKDNSVKQCNMNKENFNLPQGKKGAIDTVNARKRIGK